MKNQAELLIARFGLQPHPEGGYYREVFRSPRTVAPTDKRSERSALTGIYFLLRAGEVSRWHRVLSDESWCHLAGDPLELFCLAPGSTAPEKIILGSDVTTDSTAEPMWVVPAGTWQAAKPCGEYALVSCCVGPGFDFNDFCLAADVPDIAQWIKSMDNEFSQLL